MPNAAVTSRGRWAQVLLGALRGASSETRAQRRLAERLKFPDRTPPFDDPAVT